MNITFEELLRYAKMNKYHNNDGTTKLEMKVEEAMIDNKDLAYIVDQLIACDMSDKEIKRIKADFEKLLGKVFNEKVSEIQEKKKAPVIKFFNEDVKDIPVEPVIDDKTEEEIIVPVEEDFVDDVKKDVPTEEMVEESVDLEENIPVEEENEETADIEVSTEEKVEEPVAVEENNTIEEVNEVDIPSLEKDLPEDLTDYEDKVEDKEPVESNLEDMNYVQEEVKEEVKDISSKEINEYLTDEFYTKDELFANPKLLDGLDDEQKNKVQQLIEDENVMLVNPMLGVGINDYTEKEQPTEDLIEEKTEEQKQEEEFSKMVDGYVNEEKIEDKYSDDMLGYMKHQERPKVKTLANGDSKGFTGVIFLTVLCALSGIILFFINVLAK